jgi:hypothetical protein
MERGGNVSNVLNVLKCLKTKQLKADVREPRAICKEFRIWRLESKNLPSVQPYQVFI